MYVDWIIGCDWAFGCRSETVELHVSHIEGSSETIGASLSAISPKGNPFR